jgi:hypothetical protein
MLGLAYQNVFETTKTSSAIKRAALSRDLSEVEDDQRLESWFWSLFLNNLLYLGLFSFFGLYLLKGFEPIYQFGACSLLCAAATWRLSFQQ